MHTFASHAPKPFNRFKKMGDAKDVKTSDFRNNLKQTKKVDKFMEELQLAEKKTTEKKSDEKAPAAPPSAAEPAAAEATAAE